MAFDNYTCTSAWLNLNINVILQDLERKLQRVDRFSPTECICGNIEDLIQLSENITGNISVYLMI